MLVAGLKLSVSHSLTILHRLLESCAALIAKVMVIVVQNQPSAYGRETVTRLSGLQRPRAGPDVYCPLASATSARGRRNAERGVLQVSPDLAARSFESLWPIILCFHFSSAGCCKWGDLALKKG